MDHLGLVQPDLFIALGFLQALGEWGIPFLAGVSCVGKSTIINMSWQLKLTWLYSGYVLSAEALALDHPSKNDMFDLNAELDELDDDDKQSKDKAPTKRKNKRNLKEM